MTRILIVFGREGGNNNPSIDLNRVIKSLSSSQRRSTSSSKQKAVGQIQDAHTRAKGGGGGEEKGRRWLMMIIIDDKHR